MLLHAEAAGYVINVFNGSKTVAQSQNSEAQWAWSRPKTEKIEHLILLPAKTCRTIYLDVKW